MYGNFKAKFGVTEDVSLKQADEPQARHLLIKKVVLFTVPLVFLAIVGICFAATRGVEVESQGSKTASLKAVVDSNPNSVSKGQVVEPSTNQSIVQRMLLVGRRHPAVVAAVATAVLLAIVGVVVMAVLLSGTEEANQMVDSEPTEHEEELHKDGTIDDLENNGQTKDKDSSNASIIGGSVGGVVALVAIIIVVVFVVKRRTSFNKEVDGIIPENEDEKPNGASAGDNDESSENASENDDEGPMVIIPENGKEEPIESDFNIPAPEQGTQNVLNAVPPSVLEEQNDTPSDPQPPETGPPEVLARIQLVDAIMKKIKDPKIVVKRCGAYNLLITSLFSQLTGTKKLDVLLRALHPLKSPFKIGDIKLTEAQALKTCLDSLALDVINSKGVAKKHKDYTTQLLDVIKHYNTAIKSGKKPQLIVCTPKVISALEKIMKANNIDLSRVVISSYSNGELRKHLKRNYGLDQLEQILKSIS